MQYTYNKEITTANQINIPVKLKSPDSTYNYRGDGKPAQSTKMYHIQ